MMYKQGSLFGRTIDYQDQIKLIFILKINFYDEKRPVTTTVRFDTSLLFATKKDN
jgi:hypothetical protein